MPFSKRNDYTASKHGKISKGSRLDKYWRLNIAPVFKDYLADSIQTNSNADEYKICVKFGLRGIDYGNWTTQQERTTFLIGLDASLSQLSSITSIKKSGLGLLGMCFGSRGVPNAAAHFEPDNMLINLSRLYGFGSLAREYGHYLDYFFGTFIDQDKEERSLSGGASTSKIVKPEKQTGELRYRMALIIERAIWRDKDNKEITPMYKRISASHNAGYYRRKTELFARVFEQYVGHKTKLTNKILTKRKYEKDAYSDEEDIKAIIPLVDDLVKAMAKEAKK